MHFNCHHLKIVEKVGAKIALNHFSPSSRYTMEWVKRDCEFIIKRYWSCFSYLITVLMVNRLTDNFTIQRNKTYSDADSSFILNMAFVVTGCSTKKRRSQIFLCLWTPTN